MRHLRRALIAAGLVLASGLIASPAQAKGPGAASSVVFSSTNMTLTFPGSGAVIHCQLHEMYATLTGPGVGSINGGSFVNCQGPFGIIPITLQHVGTWHLDVTSPASTPNMHIGGIPNISIQMTSTNCSAEFTGGAPAAYDNSTGVLTVGSAAPNPNGLHLVTSNVNGCFGLIVDGDSTEWDGDYEADPAFVIP